MAIYPDMILVKGWTSNASDAKYLPVANQHFVEHPFAQHYFQTRNGKAHCISNFISENQLHTLEGLYHRYLKLLDMEDQMVTILPTTSTNTMAQNQGDAVVLALHRPQRDFSERDRLIINLLRPHLAQAFQNTQALTQAQQALTKLNQTIEQLGAIAITTNGQVRHMSKRAWELLVQYFQPVSLQSQHLLDNLQRWLNHQIAILSQGENLEIRCRPLVMEQEEQQLIVRLTVDRPGERYLLLLEEEQITPLSAAALELIGLTKPEAEVLFWVTQDKSDAEIASTSNLSAGTVRKHLEHIYQKFTRNLMCILALQQSCTR